MAAPARPGASARSVALAVGACAGTAVLFVAGLGGGYGGGWWLASRAAEGLGFGAVMSAALSVDTWNAEYENRAGVGYPWLVEGRVVEPWRETTLSAHAYDEKRDYSWTVTDGGGEAWTASGVEVVRTFTALGEYTAVVTESRSDRVGTATLYCRYVRRDVRDLKASDREAFFDAFRTLASVGAAEGKRTYGERYRSLDDFVALHLELAADRVDDHMHDGLGFLTMHVALTSFFERGLQAVNPAVAVPYWDYTRDDAKFKAAYGARTPLDARFWSLDDLWSDDWFGGAENGFHTVTSGRFAYQRVPKATADHVANPYGFLRAPWNANARPFVTRVHQLCGADALSGFGWPSCGTHHNLTFETTSYYDWAWRASYGAHGPVHAAVGGTYQCKDEYDSLEAIPMVKADVESLRVMSFVVLKSGWRAGIVEMPEACSSDAPRTDCKPKCPALEDAGKFKNISALEDMWQVLFQGARLSKSYDHDAKVQALRTICTTPIAPGDQLEASSPVDVSFWPVHPTLERLFQYKMLLGLGDDATHGFANTQWANPDGMTMYCHNNGCKGHHPYDVVPFPIFAANDGADFEARSLTNLELFNLLDPSDHRLPYVYDAFQWDHCEAQGVVFPRLRDQH